VYEEEERRLQPRGSAAPGSEVADARLLSNHAMALFGLGASCDEKERDLSKDLDAIEKLREARKRLQGAKLGADRLKLPSTPMVPVQGDNPEAGAQLHDPKTSSEATFRGAINRLLEAKRMDRARILRRKRLSVPSMLLFVASFTPLSEDLVQLAAEVICEAEACLDDEVIDDSAWLRARGLVRVLDALFVALEYCPTDDEEATRQLSTAVIQAAAKLATIREKPDVAARGGDFGAFAYIVAKARASPSGFLGYQAAPRAVPFSQLARAKRMEREARTLAQVPQSRRCDGQVLDSSLRARIQKLVERVESLV
jgi:hypothetical protein